MRINPAYRKPLRRSAWTQIFLLLLTCFIPDMGESGYGLLYAGIAFWTVAAVIVFRRNENPTKGDIFYLNSGLLIFTLLSWVLVPLIWEFIKS